MKINFKFMAEQTRFAEIVKEYQINFPESKQIPFSQREYETFIENELSQ